MAQNKMEKLDIKLHLPYYQGDRRPWLNFCYLLLEIDSKQLKNFRI